MALARKNAFPDKDSEFADWCKALGHPARLAILRTLAERDECICGELAVDLPLAQSTVSQHVKALKEAGLIQGQVDGPRSKYCLDLNNIQRFLKFYSEFAKVMESASPPTKCK